MYSAEATDSNLVYLVREEEYRDYFGTTKSGIIFLDAELRVKNMNMETEKMLGVNRSQLLGRKADNVFKRFSDKFIKVFAISEYDDFYTTNVKLKGKDKITYLHINTLKLRDAAGVLNGIIVIMQDISAVKASIKQLQTTQMLMSLGELAGGVAHHVRTPLTTISGYLQIMVNRLESEGGTIGRDVLEMLLDEVAYINNVVKELILFAKPPVHKEAGVNINRVLEDALRLTFRHFPGERVVIERDFAQLPAIVADANLLRQSFANIIRNAVEAVAGKGTIVARTWIHAELNMLVIAVSDTGEGIKPEALPRIFEPFYTTKLDRMGLGLSTAQRIVNEHNGFINVWSEKNTGTKVNIYLPLSDDQLEHLAAAHQQILNLQ